MSFGRQNNMMRRAMRPNESFHRDRRRRSVDRLQMLEGGRKRGGLSLFLEALGRFLSRGGRR